MTTTRRHILGALEAQRWLCQQAAREQRTRVAWENALEHAGECALRGELRRSARVMELATELGFTAHTQQETTK